MPPKPKQRKQTNTKRKSKARLTPDAIEEERVKALLVARNVSTQAKITSMDESQLRKIVESMMERQPSVIFSITMSLLLVFSWRNSAENDVVPCTNAEVEG